MTVSPERACSPRTSSSASVMAALAQINVSNVWIRANVADTAFHQDAAFDKDCDALGEAKYQVHVMLDHEHFDVLVKEQTFRLERQLQLDLDLASLTVGQLLDKAPCKIEQPHGEKTLGTI